MPIALHCKTCNHRFHVKDDLVGKSIRCPNCKDAVLRVPNLVQRKQVVADQWRFKGLDEQIYGPIRKAELDTWVKDGRVSDKTQILAPGQNQWQWASDFYPELSDPLDLPQTFPSNFGHQSPAQQQYHAGVQPRFAPVVKSVHHSSQSQRSKVTAGVLGLFLGGWGVHRFYLGYTSTGILQIFVTICTLGFGGLWGFIEGILILTGSFNQDVDGRILKD